MRSYRAKFTLGVSLFLLIYLIVPESVAQDIVAIGARRYIKVIQPLELSGLELNNSRLYSMPDAVRYYSGVQLKDYAGLGGFKTINLRSLGSERMRVFYNGIEISNALNAQVDIARFSMDNVGSLALYSGQKGDIFQSASDVASAGSLYITTRRPKFADSSRTNFKVTLRGGSFYDINSGVLYEHDLGNYMTTSLSLAIGRSAGNYEFRYRRKNSSGKIVYDSVSKRNNNHINYARAEGALNGILENGLWSVYFYHYTSDRGIPGSIVNNIWYRGEELTERNSFVQGNMKLDITEAYRTQLNFKFGYDYLHYENKDTHLATVDESFRQYEGYLSSSHLYKVYEDWVASGAYDIHFNKINKRDEVTFQEPQTFTRPWRLKHLASLATQGSFFHVQGQASVLATYVSNFERSREKQYESEYAITPTVLFSYTPFRLIDFSLQAYAKRSYRVPSYSDRYISLLEGTALKPETMWQYSLGMNYSKRTDAALRRYGASLEGYYHDVTNKIIAYPNGSLYRWTMANLGHVESFGGDLNLFATLRLFELYDEQLDITGKLQYSYQQARDITNRYDTYFGDQIPNIPWHSGSVILNVTWQGWALNYSFLYVGERYSRQENIAYYKMQPWYTHDMALTKQFSIATWKMRAMIELNNVLGQDYEIVPNYPMPSQVFRLTLSAEI
ncbi:MAG: TonB-dependent receptor plug domain-containing protein [Bacteroides sp.]